MKIKRIVSSALVLSLLLSSSIIAVSAKKVRLNKSKVTMIKGETLSLKITGAKNIKWKSSKKSVATVTSKGKVKAKNKGTAKITAKVGKKKYTCKVKVESPTMNKKSLYLEVGKTAILKVTGTKQKIKWSSSNISVATVTNGKVVAKSSGITTVTATISKTKYKCTVKVSESDKPNNKPENINNTEPNIEESSNATEPTQPNTEEKIDNTDVHIEEINMNKKEVELFVGEEETLCAILSPVNAPVYSKVWISSNSKIVSVEDGKIKGLSEGSAVVSVIYNNDYVAECRINVKSRMKLEKDEYTIKRGETIKIPIYIYGENIECYAKINGIGIKGKWSNTENEIRYYEIESYGEGKGSITFTNSDNDETLSVSYIAIGYSEDCSLSIAESLPITKYYKSYSGKEVYTACNVSDLKYGFSDVLGEESVELTVSLKIEKTYDNKGNDGTQACEFRIKIYDENNIVVASMPIIVYGLTVGQQSVDTETFFITLDSGGQQFRIEIADI